MKLPKTMSEIVYAFAGRQAGAEIRCSSGGRLSQASPPALFPPFLPLLRLACLVCFGSAFDSQDCPPLTPGKPSKLVVRAPCWKVGGRVSKLGGKRGLGSVGGVGRQARRPRGAMSPSRPPGPRPPRAGQPPAVLWKDYFLRGPKG